MSVRKNLHLPTSLVEMSSVDLEKFPFKNCLNICTMCIYNHCLPKFRESLILHSSLVENGQKKDENVEKVKDNNPTHLQANFARQIFYLKLKLG